MMGLMVIVCLRVLVVAYDGVLVKISTTGFVVLGCVVVLVELLLI